MKTKLLLLLNVLWCSLVFGNETKIINLNSSALQDYNLTQLIISTYPNIDANNDGDISIGEANGTLVSGNLPSTLALTFNYATFGNSGIDFTGIEHFELRKFRFTGTTFLGNYISGFNLDLSKLGGILSGNVHRYIEELYIEGIVFTGLSFSTSRIIENLWFINCSDAANLETIGQLPQVGRLKHLEINNTSLFATLNLGVRSNLETFIFRNTYIEGLNLSGCSGLENLAVEGVGELQNVTLPNSTSNLKLITINGMPKLNALNISPYTNLESLIMQTGSGFPNTNISALDFTNKTKLKVLKLENLNALSSIDLQTNTALTELVLIGLNSSITSFDFSTLTSLKNLSLSNNAVPVLDLSNNMMLETFDGYNSLLTSLNLGKNTNLKELYLVNNLFKKFDTKDLTGLERLELDNNGLTALDVSSNTNLSWLRCQNISSLKIVNMANGNNANMNEWDFKAALLDQNPNLTCILVDANVINNIPVQWQKDTTASYGLNDEIAYTDANFKNELLNYTEVIDVDGNGKIASCEAEQFKGVVNVASKSIQSLSGIEAFKNIIGLVVDNNNLGTLDVTQNTKLNFLYADNAGLNSINFQNLGDLNDLTIPNNNLSSINFTGTINLTIVSVENNKLTGLPINQLNKLLFLNCSDNELSSLTVSSNPNLETLFCRKNKFVSLATQPTTINLSNNTKLVNLDARDNALTEVDISANSNITQIIVNNNNLTKLNVANGNNANITNFVADGNASLGCIQVDTNFTPSNFWLKDANTIFSDNCATASVNDFKFNELVNVFPNPFYNQFTIFNSSQNQISRIQVFNYLGKRVLSTKKETINANQLSNGIYLVKIIFDDDKIVTKKVIKR